MVLWSAWMNICKTRAANTQHIRDLGCCCGHTGEAAALRGGTGIFTIDRGPVVAGTKMTNAGVHVSTPTDWCRPWQCWPN